MKRIGWPVIGGALLIVLGVLFLLETLGVMQIGAVIVPVLFGLGGLAFLYVLTTDRTKNWWAVIPGLTLLGLAGLIAWGEWGPKNAEGWAPAFFLAMIGLSFWIIYAQNRENWWAIIPGGVLFSIALVVGLSSTLTEGPWLGGVMFLGMGITFAVLYLLPTSQGRQKWALIPAGALVLVGILVTFANALTSKYFWPVALILGGLVLILRLVLARPRE
jgi:hypothetical protein